MTTSKDENLREKQAAVREKQAGVRENQAGVREKQAGVREDQSHIRDDKADERDSAADVQHNTLERLLKIILWVSVILFVVGAVSILRSYHLERSVELLDQHTTDLEDETNAAKEAAVEARDILQTAVNELEARRVNNAGASPEAISKALVAVDRIEQHLCGGPCEPGDGS